MCDHSPHVNFSVANARIPIACGADAYLSNGCHYVQGTEYGPNVGTTSWIDGTLIVDAPM